MRQLIDFERVCPFRRPDWRLERVLQMIDRLPTPGRSTARDDKQVRSLRNFILRYRAAVDNDANRNRLAYENPGLYFAFQIYERPEDQQHLRTTLEARILARQTDEEIAAEMHTMPEVSYWYEALFFSVRDRIDSLDWIANFVLVPAYMADQPGATPPAGRRQQAVAVAKPYFDATTKFLAYFGGKYALDYCMGGMRRGSPVTGRDGFGAWCLDNYAERSKHRALQAMQTVEFTRWNVKDLFETVNQLIVIERSAETEEGKRDAMLKCIGAMMGQMPWAVGKEGRKNLAGTKVADLDENAAELRDDEMLLLAQGRPVDTIEGIEQLKLPAPRHTGQEDQAHADVKQGS